MKISKLYIKMFLSFFAVLVVAEMVVFGLIMTDEMPPPVKRFIVERMVMTRNLIKNEVRDDDIFEGRGNQRLTALIQLLAKGFGAKIWLTDKNDRIVSRSFDGPPPTFENEGTVLPLDDHPEMRLYSFKTFRHRSVYIESGFRLENSPPLTVHILFRKHSRREEEWFLKGLLLLTALGAVFFIPVSRRFTRPVQKLSHASDRLGQGDFSQRVPDSGNDEIAVLARKFNRMADRLENMVVSGKELTAHLSHELRSPLARMRISLQMIMERNEAGSPDPKADAKLLAKIKDEIENMDTLIGKILDLSKMDMREPQPRTDRLDVAAQLNSLLENYMPMIEQGRLSVESDLPDEPFTSGPAEITCCAGDIHVLLDNVLGNAVKYTEDGGAISVQMDTDRPDLTIMVCNTHPPLTDEELAGMFTPFYRLNKGTEPGTGLGLAVARKIAETHEGNIHAEYRSGRVCIVITLPKENSQA